MSKVISAVLGLVIAVAVFVVVTLMLPASNDGMMAAYLIGVMLLHVAVYEGLLALWKRLYWGKAKSRT